MGYTTKFDGIFTLEQPLFDSQVLYLLELASTRRMKRNVALLQNVPDSARVAVGLPLGQDGGYFVNQKWDEENDWISVVDYNLPPSGQLISCTWKYECQNHDYVQEESFVRGQVKKETQAVVAR